MRGLLLDPSFLQFKVFLYLWVEFTTSSKARTFRVVLKSPKDCLRGKIWLRVDLGFIWDVGVGSWVIYCIYGSPHNDRSVRVCVGE